MITPEEQIDEKEKANEKQAGQNAADRNTGDKHMQIDEEGNEVGPDDQI
ncbi:MAG: hypothetical protein V4687_14750 [Bacteroidota bacterium]